MQEIAVFVIVALAATYVAWKLMPRGLRAHLAQATVGWARRRGRLSEREAVALARRLTASGCGSCDSCGACAPEPATVPEAIVVHFVAGRSNLAPGRSSAEPPPR